MPSSGYSAWSVVAGEQPTTAKWNILGTNDSSFNTGNGFNDNIILPRHMSNGWPLFSVGTVYTGTTPSVSTQMWKEQAASQVVTLNAGSQGSVTFPTAFPSGLVNIIVQNGDTVANSNFITGIFSATLTGFSFQFNSGGAITTRVNWRALGW